MADAQLQAWAYRVVRYFPISTRDEWMNIAVLMLSPKNNQLEVRFIRDESEFARIRRLQPAADLSLLRGLEMEFTTRLAGFEQDAAGHVAKLDDVLSSVIQLGPQRAVLTENAEAELERLYAEYVAPPRFLRATAASAPLDSPAAIRKRANEIFITAGILRHMRAVPASQFTHLGDPMRIDYAFGENGSRGFAHALALGRDPAQAKSLAFTSQRIRAKLPRARIHAITEIAPSESNSRHAFVKDLFAEQNIGIVPLATLPQWANELAARIE